jgi:hypothetical protein
MPRTERTKAAANIVNDASSSVGSLVEELAEPLAEYMLAEYSDEDWRKRPVVEALARVAALLEAEGREVPPAILSALRRATEAGRALGVASANRVTGGASRSRRSSSTASAARITASSANETSSPIAIPIAIHPIIVMPSKGSPHSLGSRVTEPAR